MLLFGVLLVQSQRILNHLNEILGQISTSVDDVEATVYNSDEDEGLSASTHLTAATQQQTMSSTSSTVTDSNAASYEMQFPQLFLQ